MLVLKRNAGLLKLLIESKLLLHQRFGLSGVLRSHVPQKRMCSGKAMTGHRTCLDGA